MQFPLITKVPPYETQIRGTYNFSTYHCSANKRATCNTEVVVCWWASQFSFPETGQRHQRVSKRRFLKGSVLNESVGILVSLSVFFVVIGGNQDVYHWKGQRGSENSCPSSPWNPLLLEIQTNRWDKRFTWKSRSYCGISGGVSSSLPNLHVHVRILQSSYLGLLGLLVKIQDV